MAKLQKKTLDAPDEKIELEGVTANVVQIGETSISRSVIDPGAHCAIGGRKLRGNHRAEESCQAHHIGVVLQGRLRVETDDGSILEIGPNDVYDVPPGHDGWVIGTEPMTVINWEGVRTWLPAPESGDRVVATLLITDIVTSTEHAVRLGDKAWRELIGRHMRDVRTQLDRYRGREVNTTGDGLLAVFDGAARAVQAAAAMVEAARSLGLEIRAGVHTGEVELAGDDVRGVAVHETARISAAAGAGEILVSTTTYQLAKGAGLEFEDRGESQLKGLSGTRGLFAFKD
jgi:class 3 adenylate cyclase/mannose-6-phosphate isomerase-like protein (cupin superfamily)